MEKAKEHKVSPIQLKDIPCRIFTDKGGGEIKLYRLGVYDDECFELVELEENRVYPPHIHKESSSVFHMIKGKGIILIHNDVKEYKTGDTFTIPHGIAHGFHTQTTTLFLSSQKPPIINEESDTIDIAYI